MNDDYLWDKTGQPDPQIQQLEEILGTLRYRPKPLVLPDDVRVRQRRNYLPLVAIAASVLLAILAGAIWLRVRSRNDAPAYQAIVEPVTPQPDEAPKPPVNKSAVNQPLLATHRIHAKRSASRALPKREREEALVAKEQLMLALRVTTQKLHLVHTKTQSPTNQIKNQHRVG